MQKFWKPKKWVLGQADPAWPHNLIHFNAVNIAKYNVYQAQAFNNVRSTLLDVTISIQIEGTAIHAILDSGSETNLIGSNLLDRKIPHWRSLPSVAGPTGGIGADGSEFQILDNKVCTFFESGTYFSCPIAVANKANECLLGLTFLREANVSMFFSKSCIDLYMNNVKIKSMTQKGDSYDKVTMKYPFKIVLNPNQMKTIKFHSLNFQNGITYCIHSNALSWSIVIPTLEIAERNTLRIVIRNDSRKKIYVKPNQLLIDFEVIDDADEVFNFNEPEFVEMYSTISQFEDLPIPFYNKDCVCNKGLYSKKPEYIVRNYFKNGLVSKPNIVSEPDTVEPVDSTVDKDTFEALSDLAGYEIDVDPVPWPDISTIIEEAIPRTLKPELRQFLIDLFKRYPEIIARHNWDCGILSDYAGNPVLLDIPLKSELPIFNKSYALSKEDRDAISDIFDYLIYHGLAINCKIDNQTGCPAFLVPRSDLTKSKRLVCDTRKTNTFISAPCSTQSTQVLTEIQNLLAERRYCTSLDILQAYYTLRLSQSSLDSNISNIYTGDRCIKMLVALTGTSYIPLYFNKKLNEVLNTDDLGHFSPLNNRINGYASWFDDLYTVSSNVESHKVAVTTLVHRIHRSKIKINLKKSFFFKNILTDDIMILGHEIKGGSIVPDDNKLKILTEFTTPNDRKNLQSFLGHLNFLRNLLPLQIIHLTTILTPLTSPTVEFKWLPKHTQAFNEIKELLNASANYLECPLKNAINIVYTDSSDSLLGGILFQYVPSKTIVRSHATIPDNVMILNHADNRSENNTDHEQLEKMDYRPFIAHIVYYKLAMGLVPYERIPEQPIYNFVVKLAIIATRWSQNKEWNDKLPTKEEVSIFLATIYCHISEIQSKVERTTFRIIMDRISESDIDDEFFFTYAEELLIILSVISAHNIKLIFGIGRELKAPFMNINLGYEHDIVLGWCVASQRFILFYILEDWEDDQFPCFKLYTNKDLLMSNCTEAKVLALFQDALKSASASQNIRIVGQFSKTISAVDMARPIYIKEITALLYGLESFSKYIANSKLTLLVSDSKVAYFLFHADIHRSVKKIEKWSVKISISYPNVRMVHVTSRNQVADFLSRIGLSKSKFFSRSLTPVSLNKMLWDKMAKPYATWEEIYKITQDCPEVINFSEKKLPYAVIDQYYLDSSNYVPDEGETKSFNLITLRKRFSILDSLINRQKIIEYQLKETNPAPYTERNGLLLHNDKIVLPPSLYSISLIREHFLNAHISAERLLEIIENLFHIENKKFYKEIATKLVKSCLACLLNNVYPTRYIRGMFNVQRRNQTVQIDFIEGLPGIQFCLSIIDLYSSYISVYPAQNKTINTIMVCLSSYISIHGNIDCIIADNYPGFRSKKLQEFCTLHGIRLAESAPYISEGRSLVERCQRTYQFAVRAFRTTNNGPWINLIPLVIYLINNRPFHGFPDITPHSLHFKSYLNTENNFRMEQKDANKTPLDAIMISTRKDIINELEKVESEFIEARFRSRKERMERANQKRKVHDFKINDIVVLKRRYQVIGTVRKLRSYYNPIPYRVTKTNIFNVFVESLLDSSITMRSPKDLKRISYLTKTDIDRFNIPSALLEQYALIQLTDLEDIFLNEFRQDIGHGVVTRAQAKNAQTKDSNEDTIDQVLNEYLWADDEDYFDDAKKVTFVDSVEE